MKLENKILAIVVKYRQKEKLKKCLQALKKAKVKFMIIDNDQSNRGFAKAVNLGIKKALRQKISHVLLINPDVIVPKNFLKSISHNSADIVAPVIKFKRNNQQVKDFGGLVNLNWGTTVHMENQPIKTPDYVSGAAMLIKSQVFQKIGLFDERFFLYFEDVDFCLRAKQAGFKLAVEPKAVVFHQLQEGKQKSWFKKYHHFKSQLTFINKYCPWWQRPLAWAKIILCSRRLF